MTHLSGHKRVTNVRGGFPGRKPALKYADPKVVGRKLRGWHQVYAPSFSAMTIMECWI